MTPPIIGIDLGTTNSCGAIADANGKITLIPYRGGEHTIPSLFAIDSKGQELVGYEAKRQWMLNPRNTIFGAKRLIGATLDSPLVARMRQHITYTLVAGTENDVRIQVADKTLTLADISAKILERVRDVASAYLGEKITRAVVTVPAYFNDRQRQIVREAGRKAKLDIVRMINEPTAAALAYGALRPTQQTVVVYDLGGGTFDISVIDIRDRLFEVQATGGDVFLGGLDFDNALIGHVLADFKSKYNVDLTADPVAMQRIRDMAENTKVELSHHSETHIKIPFIAMGADNRPLDIDLSISRPFFEQLTAPLIQRTLDTCADVLKSANLTPQQIDAVLLVGGQTRMPLIQQKLTEFFGKPPSRGVHPDEAVAVGAALYARSLEDQSTPTVKLHDVLPMGIAIERGDGSLHPLFERNAPVPTNRAFTFTTHEDDQQDLIMRIFQGDAPMSSQNTLLGDFTFAGLRPSPAGSVRVEVVFSVDSEGILTLAATDQDTRAHMKHTVRFTK